MTLSRCPELCRGAKTSAPQWIPEQVRNDKRQQKTKASRRARDGGGRFRFTQRRRNRLFAASAFAGATIIGDGRSPPQTNHSQFFATVVE